MAQQEGKTRTIVDVLNDIVRESHNNHEKETKVFFQEFEDVLPNSTTPNMKKCFEIIRQERGIVNLYGSSFKLEELLEKELNI